jgi:hypothetical protein
MSKLLIAIFFLFIQHSLLPQLNNNWTELKKQVQDSPDVLIYPHGDPRDESYEMCTYVNGSIYIGTNINGHVYKIDNPLRDSLKLIIDIGYLGGNFNTPIKALTNDGQYVYGASSENIYLFYIDSEESEQTIQKIAQYKLLQNNIRYLFCPQIYVTDDYQYIYFAALSDHQLKLVRWRIKRINGQSEPNTSDEMIEIFPVGFSNISDNYISSIGLTTMSFEPNVWEPVIVGGTAKNQIIIHRINHPNERVHEIENLNFNTNLILAFMDYPNKVFIYDDNKFYKYDLMKEEINSINVHSVYETWSLPFYLNGYLYTHFQKINLNNLKTEDYNGVLTGRRIMYDSNSTLFGISKWGQNDPMIKKTDLRSLNVYEDFFTSKIPMLLKPPYGGSIITALAVYNNTVFGCMGTKSNDFIWAPSEKKWIYQNYPEGVANSNCMLVKDNRIYYGNYNRPWFFVRNNIGISVPNFTNKIDLQTYIGDADQIHIYSMKSFGDNIYMSTYPRDGSLESTKACILRYICKETDSISEECFLRVGKVNTSKITNIEVVQDRQAPNFVYIYGATKNGVFTARYDNLNKNNSDEIFYINDNIKATSIIYASNRLYIIVAKQNGTYLLQYNELPTKNIDFSTENFTSLKLFDDTCYESQMVVGNDGFLYLFYTTTGQQVSRLEKIDITDSQMPYVNKIVWNEKSDTDYNLRISFIAVDKGNIDNKSLYVGFWKGNLIKL